MSIDHINHTTYTFNDNLREGVYRSTPDDHFLYVNQAFVEMFGFDSVDEALSYRPSQLFADPRTRDWMMSRAHRNERYQFDEVMFKRKNGDTFWGVDNGLVVYEDGIPVYYDGAIMDITERRLLEETLYQFIERFSKAFYDSPCPIAIFNPMNASFQDANESFSQLVGYSRHEILNQSPIALNLLEPAYEEKLMLLLKDESSVRNVPVRLFHKDGTLRYTLLSVENIMLEDVSSRFLMFIDLTQATQAEESLQNALGELEKQRSILDQILSTTPDYMIVYDLEGRHTFINQAALRMFGMLTEEVIGKTSQEVGVPESVVQNVVQAIQHIIQTEETIYKDIAWLHDDTTFYFEATYSPLYDHENRLIGILSSGRDITERKKAEETLRRQDKLQLALQKEREMNTLKSKLVTTISHQFRTPLAVILSSAEILSKYFERLTEEKRHEHIHKIRVEVNNLAELISDVAMVAESQLEQMTITLSKFDLQRLSKAVVSEIHETIGSQHQIEVITDAPDHVIRADHLLLRRMLINLLSNAIHYSPAGSLITVTLMQRVNEVVLTVEDQGIGIPPEDLPRIFEPFHRGNNVGMINGTGLGLSIVRDTVEAHQGTIHVESEKNIGTRLTITLPLFRDTGSAPAG